VQSVAEHSPGASDAAVLRQGAFAPDWPARVVLDLLPRADWMAGRLLVVSGRTLRRRPLPAPADHGGA
jgi:hypothetical protein